ncbi:Retrovirus-related Pol polyprotein from transposon RE2 [Sesamum angolense]|uniref:Retrovirus-related Pol polyprotein from transposon RE2 n=1 Tax=Sesamum angolense TaxID=2727404 RepID=A0AAE1WAU6_9LAMI|nr:Retrovirus-related Pol polyprotein from transposon RE2 [Sesamum angolense]
MHVKSQITHPLPPPPLNPNKPAATLLTPSLAPTFARPAPRALWRIPLVTRTVTVLAPFISHICSTPHALSLAPPPLDGLCSVRPALLQPPFRPCRRAFITRAPGYICSPLPATTLATSLSCLLVIVKSPYPFASLMVPTPISGSGTIQPTNHLTLTDVLFAPKIPVNLISVMALSSWSPSLPTLKKILAIESARLEFKSCELGKHHHASFPPQLDKRSSSPFTLAHSDIWGPCRIESLNGGDTPYSCHFPDKPLFGIAPKDIQGHRRGIGVMILQSRRSFYFCRCYLFRTTPFYSPHSSPAIPHDSVPYLSPLLSLPPHTEPPTRPLQVYSHHNRSTTTTLTASPSLPPTAAPGNPSATSANDLPIALRKGTLASGVEDGHGRRNVCSHLKGGMELVAVPPNADVVVCRWFFTLKFRANGTLERYKARPVAKGFTQTYGVDYFEIFSPDARLNFIRVLFSLAVNLNWLMYQMSIKNAFLYGDLNEIVYMEQPPGYVAQGETQHMVCKLKNIIYGLKQSSRAWFDKFSRIIGEFGFLRCQADHSVFVQTTRSGIVVLPVYFDDILITGSDIVGIEEGKTYLPKHFVTKDWGDQGYSTLNLLKNLLKELGFMCDDLVPMHCDNQATILLQVILFFMRGQNILRSIVTSFMRWS